MSRRVVKFCIIVLCIASLTAILTCARAPLEVPAPQPYQPVEPLPERYPDIQSLDARILTEEGILTNDVNIRVGLPGYPTTVGGGWGGSVIYYLDVMPPTMPDKPATTAEGTYVATANNSQLWKDLSPGNHIFSAQLVNTDSVPLDPPVTATLEFTVPDTASGAPVLQSVLVQTLCSLQYRPLTIPGPQQQQAKPCADINVSPEVFNFIIVNKIGQEAVPGEGHYIYYFNVSPPTKQNAPAITKEGTYAITTDSYVTWAGVETGKYEVWVQLVNNDNTPLEPPVVARAELIVPPDAARYPGF